ncbi:nitrite reductase large subunit NirB [Mucilaginibacter auburnensis]|uniref:Nitrite reductase (NADH) large subunit n=1 Tax=Mucilaginibacter auburnensis TaxID=1457233 RepID=A0A2H9VSK5_9SPHI|nr:nitrite reductase large subunit NirB [Mucilaginibacter auburnensis]PJJ83795.1 nitrite reductase (NADH) large subunit [Mucilaginibacter auburnensis]
MEKSTVIVIGNGMVGYKFCEKLVTKSSNFKIVVFGEEPRHAYDRVHLSEYFNGKSADDLSLSTASWYAESGIDLHLSDPVKEINRAEKTIHSLSGLTLKYDYLVLATGSSAFVPDIPGVEKDGVFVYRTIEDLELIKAYATTAKTGAVMGGGLLGLEAAKALIDLGIESTHVIEFAPRLMPRQIDSAGSGMLQAKLKELGLSVHLNKSTAYIGGEHRAESLNFNDGSELPIDMLVISAGIRPRDELAKLCGLEVGTRGGILVDAKMQTSDESIFAIGECALYEGMIYGLVAPGYEMADIVVSQLTGGSKLFYSYDMSTKLKLIGVDVASFGDAFITEPDCRTIVFEDTHKGIYKRINITTDGKYLLGGILIGDADAYNMLLQTVNNKLVLPPNPEDLILGSRGGAESEGAGVMSLPDDALICSCEAVTKGAICSSVTDLGITSVDGIKKCTKAGTGCGGCMPMVKDLVNGTLKANGAYVKNNICEHFDYSRQELYDLVKMNQLKNYDLVLDHFGKGDGCETCKPLVASILSSLWNEVIVKQSTIQDSNDRYLANIQKGGTYSVVPRIPGGEITPDKLIVIGQVAKKYNLYTKITGGQRIDLFGAHVSDLPLIWEELIDAGFESGHAYGKALRTVKSCVGSTWCRFGLHDSVSFAIEVEDRYKGIRAPHKIKGGVSGCIRECAEAQSKDFGIIATEKGWNLYVCGNGGSKPQHAQLLATDIDKETLVKYLDRFLMFYIKTADPLARTATWLNKMEGGMSYLKNVIINDSLGICAQLEEEMQQLVNTYHCEWKEVIENPELRKKFSHFVNAPEQKDPNVKFEEMRGQVKANW